MPLPGDQITRPNRPWKGPLGDALEAGIERLRDHLRRSYRSLNNQLTPDQLHSENVGRRWDGLTHSYTDVEVDCPETDLSTAPSAPQCELTGTGLT